MKTKNLFLPVLILFVLGFTVFSACYCSDCNTETVVPTSTVVFETGDELDVAIADTKEERAQGLMHVEEMGMDKGMLFIFEKNSTGNFWMKNTLIPLDMIFVDEDLKIMFIQDTAMPCKTEKCKTYGPGENYMYTIETNAGYAKSHGIEVGMEVELEIV